MEIKRPKWPSAHVHGQQPAYVDQSKHTSHILAYAARVSEVWKRQVFYNNGWGLEWISHRLGAVPNPFFPLYKALHGTFSKHTEIPREKPEIH